MSRYSDDYAEYDGEPRQILALGRWERNARAVLKSKRGRKALAELREALLALPEHRLIAGAVCTVDAAGRGARWTAEAQREWERADPRWRPSQPCNDQSQELGYVVRRNGEGVCAVGALAWHRRVRAGDDPGEAFAALPDLADEGEDALSETAHLGESIGLAYTLAWELAYRNDEIYSDQTPEARHAAFLEWIDKQLAETETANA